MFFMIAECFDSGNTVVVVRQDCLYVGHFFEGICAQCRVRQYQVQVSRGSYRVDGGREFLAVRNTAPPVCAFATPKLLHIA